MNIDRDANLRLARCKDFRVFERFMLVTRNSERMTAEEAELC